MVYRRLCSVTLQLASGLAVQLYRHLVSRQSQPASPHGAFCSLHRPICTRRDAHISTQGSAGSAFENLQLGSRNGREEDGSAPAEAKYKKMPDCLLVDRQIRRHGTLEIEFGF